MPSGQEPPVAALAVETVPAFVEEWHKVFEWMLRSERGTRLRVTFRGPCSLRNRASEIPLGKPRQPACKLIAIALHVTSGTSRTGPTSYEGHRPGSLRPTSAG